MRGDKIKVLLVYHGAALEPSRKVFEALATQEEVQLRVLGPRIGLNPLRNLVVEIPKPYYGKYDLVTGRVYGAMRDFSGPYLTGLLREILLYRPDVIHVFNEAYSLVNVQALLYRNIFLPGGKSLCLGVQNLITREAKTHTEELKRSFVHKQCDGVACWSGGARDALRGAGFPGEKLMVTYWGVPLDRFSPSQNRRLRRQLGISGKFVVGYVGRLRPEKGLDTLLLALRRLPPLVHCLCVGDGCWRDAFLTEVRELGLTSRVHWIPRVPDGQVPAYMNAMDALVLPSKTTPSWKEQFGRVLAEAMACGVPVIGSDSGAIPEVIGDAGLIFPECEHVELAEAIGKLATDSELRRRLADMGAKRASTHFSCKVFAAKLVSLYEHVVEHTRESST